MERETHPILKKVIVFMALATIPFFYDLLKILGVNLSSFTGYNLMLGTAPKLSFSVGRWDINLAYPFLLPTIEEIGMLKGIEQSLSFSNFTWAGILAYLSFIFIGGLLAGGYFGLIKDILRNRTPRFKVFLQFCWYYGPRLFLLSLMGFIVFSAISSLGFEQINLLLGLVFFVTPFLAVLTDCGIIEAIMIAPTLLLKGLVGCLRLLAYKSLAALGLSCIAYLFPLGAEFLSVILWPGICTYISYEAMEYLSSLALEEPLVELPRERLRGYGHSLIKTFILIMAFVIMAGLPTALSKNRYFSTLLPWHEPVLEMQGFAYKTRGSLVYAKQNDLKEVKVLIDSISPSREEIVYRKPGVIRGRGRILSDARPIYFTYELTRASQGERIVYSLQNGGKIEATDGLWGNPVDRGALITMTADFDVISGVIYDKRHYSEISTIWSEEGKAVFLGPMENQPELYGFYAAEAGPKAPIEFQWLYNRSMPWPSEGEKSPVTIMEKLNNAFESLDLDLLLGALYYVNDLQPEDLPRKLQHKFEAIRWKLAAKGLENWEDIVVSNLSYYPITDVKMGIVGDYHYAGDHIGFRAEVFKIGVRWKLIKMSVEFSP